MKTTSLIFILFLGLGLAFIIGSAFSITPLLLAGNFLLVPVLLLYYRFTAQKLFMPIVVILLLLYLRDLILFFNIEQYLKMIWFIFIPAILIMFLCLITAFKSSKVHPVEFVSFAIMYSFLAFLFFMLSEAVPDGSFMEKFAGYSYLLLLMVLMGGSFTTYILKSHMASLWFMIATSSLLVSEVSLFFKVLIIEDVSVNLFYPLFHVLAYYGFVEFGIRRRPTGKYIYF